MKCLDKFNKKMQLSGGSLRNERLLDSKRLLNEVFKEDTSYTYGLYMWNNDITDYSTQRQLEIRLFNRKFSTANGTLYDFHTEITEPIVVGDVVYDSIHNEYMICTEVANINDIHYQGKFTICNWILRWQNDNGKIFNYPCQDINSTQYNSGETSNRTFTIGTSQHMLTLPCDENTVILETPKRFYLDKNPINPTSFIITQNDNTSYNYGSKGLVKLTVSQYVGVVERDRPDLGICDYIDFDNIDDDIIEDTTTDSAKIIYTTTSIISGGNSKEFIAKFYNKDKDEIIKTPLWEIICDFKEELEVSQFSNQISISINNDDYVDEYFKLILYDKDDLTCSDSLIIKIDSLL